MDTGHLLGADFSRTTVPTHISWPSIELLHNVVKDCTLYNQRTGAPFRTITYKAKVKLHGTNCSVQVTDEGIFAQSREIMLTPTADLKGFAQWVEASKTAFRNVPKGITIFGEWCGQGVEGGMAISQHPKIWAVFGILLGGEETSRMVYDPVEIAEYLSTVSLPEMYILPWEDGIEFTIDYGDKTSLDAAAMLLNERVSSVEKEDPWVKATFGISGLGEGIVLYPQNLLPERDFYRRYMFKAKGEKHRTANVREAVQVDPTVVASIEEFANVMVAEARLLQGVTVACGGAYDKKLTGKFIQWVTADTEKESQDELEASGLTWTQVKSAVSKKAQVWYLGKM